MDIKTKYLNYVSYAVLLLYALQLGSIKLLGFFGLQNIFFYIVPFSASLLAVNSIFTFLKSGNLKVLGNLSCAIIFLLGFVWYFVNISFIFSDLERSSVHVTPSVVNENIDKINDSIYSNDPQKARNIANYLYQSFGIKIPYKINDTDFVAFIPDSEEIESRQKETIKREEDSRFNTDTAKNARWKSNYLLIGFGASFLVFMYLFGVRQRNYNQQLHRTP
jgi:hypothetical protein